MVRVVKSAVTKMSSLRVWVTSALVRVSAAGQPSSSAITASGWMPDDSRKLSSRSRSQTVVRGASVWQSIATCMTRPCAVMCSRATRDIAAYLRWASTNDVTGFGRAALSWAKRRIAAAPNAGGFSTKSETPYSGATASAASWAAGVEQRTAASNSPTLRNSSTSAWTPSTPHAAASSAAEEPREQIAASWTPGVLIRVGTMTSAACAPAPTRPMRRGVMSRGCHDPVRYGRRTCRTICCWIAFFRLASRAPRLLARSCDVGALRSPGERT